MVSEIPVPPPGTVQAALRKTTEYLAQELAYPRETAPDWSQLEWRTARAVAAIHGVSSLLADRITWAAPPGWREFLEEQRAHTVRRHQRIKDLLDTLDARLKSADITAVALKGVALHELGLYAPGERPMSDIDLLVPEHDGDRLVDCIQSLGYHQSLNCWKHRAFAPDHGRTAAGFGEHSDNDIKIEVHHRVCELLPVRATDISPLVFPSKPHPGLSAYPSRAALMAHLLLHAAGGMRERSLRLLHLNDLARLASRMTDVDWDQLLGIGQHLGQSMGQKSAGHDSRHHNSKGSRALWWAWPPLALTSRYYSNAIPFRVLTAIAPACPPVLGWVTRHQKLSDVSHSRLWIEALPGVEWARTPLDVTRCMMQRLIPSDELRATRSAMRQTEPGLAESSWSRLSQGRRILRFITSRPARPLTLHAVRSALAQPS